MRSAAIAEASASVPEIQPEPNRRSSLGISSSATRRAAADLISMSSPVERVSGQERYIRRVNAFMSRGIYPRICGRKDGGGCIMAGPKENLGFEEKRRCVVPTYVMLANYTDAGAQKVKESPRRLDAAKKILKDMGGDFKTFYLTMGDYDIVAIYEAPDDAVAARFTLQLGKLGNVRTRTLKDFPEAGYRDVF